MTPRATPMPADDRRAALIAATLPLLREHGRAVSTRQISAAAGVAEGTIFRVFPSKDALIDATIATAFAPEPIAERLTAIDAGLALRDRLIAAIELLQDRLSDVFGLLLVMEMYRPPPVDDDGKHCPPESPVRNDLVMDALTGVLAPDADRLRMSPADAAHAVRLLTFSATHPLISDGKTLTAAEIADLVLDGVRINSGETAC